MTEEEIKWVALEAIKSLDSKKKEGQLILSQELNSYIYYYTNLYLEAKTQVKVAVQTQERATVSQDHSNHEPLPDNPFKI